MNRKYLAKLFDDLNIIDIENTSQIELPDDNPTNPRTLISFNERKKIKSLINHENFSVNKISHIKNKKVNYL